MWLGLRRATYGEPDADAFHSMLRGAESLKAATGVAQGAGARETRTEVQRRQGGISVQNPHPIFEKWEVLPHVERKR
jgi:hypothetical protein